ncbi:MAG: amidohydrolase family protein [Acidimicrobiales bacterium]
MTGSPRLVLTAATLVDGDHPALADAHVVVEGERIVAVGPGPVADPRPDDRVVDLGGRTVMPGMVNCHFHATYHNLGAVPAPFGLEEPMALQAVRAVNNLGLLVECGFTSAVSAGAPFAIDASMKVAIDRGLIPGPRLVPCSRDISTTGHAGDRSYPPHWQVGALGAIRPSDGPDEFRRSVRAEVKEGAEFIKMFVTGGHGTVGPKEQIEMTRDELAAGIEAAHLRGAKVRGHIANREAIMMALDLRIDVIDHGDGMDDECMERIVETGTPLVPSMMFPARFLASMGGSSLGFTDSMKSDIDAMADILPKANAAGMRIVLGDDYGAIFFPHGTYAEELAYYVEEVGIPTLDVIRWATKHGAELMGRGHELGTVTAGKRADLLVVDGDPLADIRVLQDRSRLLAIVQDGRMVKDGLVGLPAG